MWLYQNIESHFDTITTNIPSVTPVPNTYQGSTNSVPTQYHPSIHLSPSPLHIQYHSSTTSNPIITPSHYPSLYPSLGVPSEVPPEGSYLITRGVPTSDQVTTKHLVPRSPYHHQWGGVGTWLLAPNWIPPERVLHQQ